MTKSNITTNKLEIAKELLATTKNINLKNFIEEYINNFNEIQNKNNKELETLDLFEYINFDRCIEYINNSKFNIGGTSIMVLCELLSTSISGE